MSVLASMRVRSLAGGLACLLAIEGAASADAHAEAGAQSALKKAAADYRAKHYATAGRRLEKALKTCGDDACASGTRAALLRDLGVMQFRQDDAPAAAKSFDDAVALDTTASLTSRYDRPDVHAAWDAAKQRAADAANAAHASETTEAATPAPAAPPETTPPPPVQDEAAAEPPPVAAHYEHLWLGVAGAFDMIVLPSGTDLCKLTPKGSAANSFNAYCTNPDGSDFPTHATTAQNDALVPGQAGTVKGGLQIGDIRAMVAADYAVSAAWLVGARAGYVMNTYPGTVAVQTGRAYGHPIHVEARVTHLFGQDPLAHVGFAPMVFVAGGVSEFDGHLATSVSLSGIAGTQRVNIWITDGPWFLTLGGGVRYAFSLRAAFSAAVRVNAAFDGNGLLPTAGPEVAFQYGF
jgi:hypothetical protein